MTRLLLPFILFVGMGPALASRILVPMDDAQKNHLKAYGIAYWVLKDRKSVV